MGIELTGRCGVCRCYIDSEDLFCANCGTENPLADDSSNKLEHAPSHHSFGCKSCGAAMSYDASAQALRCPFCGSTDMQKNASVRSVKPDRVLPFSVDRTQAEGILRKWLGSGFWRPNDAARAASIGEIAAVLVPYWLFEATTDTIWTADSSPPPTGSRGDWYPLSGTISSRYFDILVGGSSILAPQETNAIAPFEMRQAVGPDEVDLDSLIIEEFRVPRKLARPMAKGAIEELDRKAVAAQVPNRSRNIRLNVQISSMHGRPVLLPVWILAYRYKQDVHRVLLNGQSGKITGSAPFSYGKLTVVLLILAALIAAIVLLTIVANA